MRKLIFPLLFAISFFTFATHANAETINSFDVNLMAHKDGSMNVTESINYDFEYGQRHGIYRYIPLSSKVGDLYRNIGIDNVKVLRDGKEEKFDRSTDKGQISLKIGNPDKTITGAHSYVISYTVENGVGSNFSDHDEIYWNVTGNGWEVPINKASIKFDNDFGATPTNFLCFTGITGSKDKNCTVSGQTVSSDSTLNPNEGLTAVAVYPKGTFPPSILSKEPTKSFGESLVDLFFSHILLIYFFLNIILPIGILIWYEKHKNKKRFGSPVVNFDIPKDAEGARIAPALAGTIDNAKLARDDVTATLFDLAIRKYIILSEEKVSKTLGFLGSGKKQKITKLKEADIGLNSYELELHQRLFRDGDSVFADDLKTDFYLTYQDMEDKVFATLVSKKYFVRNPKGVRSLLAILGVLSLFTINIFLALVLFFLAHKLIGRTALGDEVDFNVDGLKLFLKSMDRNYKWQADKFYVVEQMIPYAMALGYIDKFMEQLKIINPDYNPTWYRGYSGNFYLAYGAFYSSLNSNITTASPSSSGAGGGGFSGGGGGGGGGGSW